MDTDADTPQKPEKAIQTIAVPASFDAAEVGAILREARLTLQRDLVDVASDLRIRQFYLQAIEDGRLDDLPGPAYTTGFVRAYGDYLGLDGREIVKRFKAAGGASRSRTDLQLPSPVEEGRLPTRSALLLAALLAVVAYGGWYYMASTDGEPAETIAALPDRLAALVSEDPTEIPNGPSELSTDTPTDTMIDGADETAALSTPVSSQPDAPANGAVAPAPIRRVQAASVPAPNGGVETPTIEPMRTSETAGSASHSTSAPETPTTIGISAPRAAASASQISDETLGNGVLGRSAMVAPQAGGGLSPLGGGATQLTEARIATGVVLQANTDSWVEVRASGSAPVYSGLLRQGDIYYVPEQPGLRLMTGNAGGIDILVNGKAIPKLGPRGAIKRGVILDPDRLMGLLAQ